MRLPVFKQNRKLKKNILFRIWEDNKFITASDKLTKQIFRRKSIYFITVIIIFSLTLYSQVTQKQFFQNQQTQLFETVNELNSTNKNQDNTILEQENYHSYKNIIPLETSIGNETNHYISILGKNNIRISSLLGLDVRTIVIDPGHGGQDPGALGKNKTFEKDIVLDIALILKQILDQNEKYNILLTRSDDRFISLSDRAIFTNKNKADIFISLHVNALPQKNVNLTETYFYGSTNNYNSILLAKLENQNSGYSTETFGELFTLFKHRNKEQESSILATHIQNTLYENIKKNHVNISDGGIKTAPFAVLLGVEAPAILVEISCISYEQEELNLKKPSYRREIAKYIKRGIVNYLRNRNNFID